MGFGDTVNETVNEHNRATMVESILQAWLANPPSHADMVEIYRQRGQLKAQQVRLERAIERAEEDVTAESAQPRGNEAKRQRIQATADLRDQLASVEAGLIMIESEVKILEFARDMIRTANYQLKHMYDL